MKKAHFIGIAGVGMSGTALLLKEAGWQVTGSDAEAYGPPREILERRGIHFTLGYDPKNVPADVDCFVIGRNAKLSPSENAEVRAAHETGKPIFTFPEMLGELTKERSNVVVVGSYGKSTTTSLVAHLIRHAGTDAGYFVGAEPAQTETLPSPAKIGSAQQFVLEGDEYPSGHDDARAKFLHLHPTDVLLTSLVHDHVNVYPTFDSYREPFAELLKLLPQNGLLVVCADEKGALTLAEESSRSYVTYGLTEGDFQAKDIQYSATTSFVLTKNGEELGRIETNQLGAHNVQNIVGAAAYVLTRGLASFKQIQDAVPEFKGVRRRLDNLAPSSKVPVFEGFGSSYEKARSAIEAIKKHFSEKPLVIVFEPHTFGWRNRANLAWYDDVFKGADRVIVLPPETQGAGTHDQLTHQEILDRVRNTGVATLAYESPGMLATSLIGDEVVLVLTSGDLHGTLTQLAEQVSNKFGSGHA